MLEAQPLLAGVARIETTKTDKAEREITELLRLFNRIPSGEFRPKIISVPTSAIPFLNSLVQNGTTYPRAPVLPTIPGSPSLSTSTPPRSMSFSTDRQVPNAPGLTPSLWNTAFDVSEPDDAHTEADPQLLEYSKEPTMSWEDLNDRTPLGSRQEPDVSQLLRMLVVDGNDTSLQIFVLAH